VATTLGVPNLSVSSADFGLLIRALQAQGKLQVLSNPQVMANNNETASIQVGEDVAIVTGTERTPQGSLRSDVTRRDVGIILEVTPTISSDGFVRMEIEPSISALTARTTQISEDFQAPVISKREVNTVVTVKDGQSVLIGGLIQTSEEKRRSKVPILGDIPLLGLPFRTEQMTKAKTELLVILTPHIVPGGAEQTQRTTLLTDLTIDRLSEPRDVRRWMEYQRAPEPVPPAAPDWPGGGPRPGRPASPTAPMSPEGPGPREPVRAVEPVPVPGPEPEPRWAPFPPVPQPDPAPRGGGR
jgi:type II secretory pathway component GspD/PulD (secretin)